MKKYQVIGGQYISIHAPREGCDDIAAMSMADFADFNPRTP